ncbi:Tetratricopeptide repeat-containing protein [Azospirillum oryzae]|uniref:Tetratricopeptide repeat-containing protein n=1 Tax=Azospirillum oryzae TaxID=286727 RepID=A0A1X7E8B4_9PROT|nr:tetratricopeptide repeat protein [Azospirillum oryzae]SMF29384.1 Tetratricopeptide repeat-containing protein [Azospirillum oryzae]
MTGLYTLLAEAFDRHQTGGFEEAERLYRRILAIEPAEAEALHRAGLLVAQLGRLEEADGLLRRALALDPAETEAAVNHGKILRALRRPGAAARRFRHALALAPALLTAQEGLGHAEREGGHAAAAATAYGRAALAGAGPAVLHQWGVALDGIGLAEEAVEALRRSAHLDPTVPSVALRLAGLLQRMGRGGEAAGWYRHALVLQPGHAEARRSLSVITGAGTSAGEPPSAA